MPHCIIEYSKDFEQVMEPAELISLIHTTVLNSNLFDKKDVRTRAVAYSNYKIGTSNEKFIHIAVRILSGRDHDQIKKLSNAVFEGVQYVIKHSATLTVEIIEIDRKYYQK